MSLPTESGVITVMFQAQLTLEFVWLLLPDQGHNWMITHHRIIYRTGGSNQHPHILCQKLITIGACDYHNEPVEIVSIKSEENDQK